MQRLAVGMAVAAVLTVVVAVVCFLRSVARNTAFAEDLEKLAVGRPGEEALSLAIHANRIRVERGPDEDSKPGPPLSARLEYDLLFFRRVIEIDFDAAGKIAAVRWESR